MIVFLFLFLFCYSNANTTTSTTRTTNTADTTTTTTPPTPTTSTSERNEITTLTAAPTIASTPQPTTTIILATTTTEPPTPTTPFTRPNGTNPGETPGRDLEGRRCNWGSRNCECLKLTDEKIRTLSPSDLVYKLVVNGVEGTYTCVTSNECVLDAERIPRCVQIHVNATSSASTMNRLLLHASSIAAVLYFFAVKLV